MLASKFATCVSAVAVAAVLASPTIAFGQTGTAGAPSLSQLNVTIDRQSVAAAGLGNSGDFAHQFHIAFSAIVTGECVFSGQPLNCAITAVS